MSANNSTSPRLLQGKEVLKIYSPNPEVNTKIHKLLKLGVPPVPVAPKLDPKHPEGHHIQRVVKRYSADKPSFVFCDGERVQVSGDYCTFSNTSIGDAIAPIRGDFVRLDSKLNPIARFTGKNPSYLDRNGNPKICLHGEVQNRLPSEQEIKNWFANPNTGIGTLGGHNGIVWLDFDAKNYPTQEDCDRDVQALLDRIGKPTLTEKTGSGGYRIAVIPTVKPTFTNFSTEPGGKHLGEALFQGRFTVLAPSQHPNGNHYIELCDADPVEVQSLEAIGLYPSKDEETERQKQNRDNTYQNFSSSMDNPWDIRNFAIFLEGYTERADGWGYAKCPAHNGTSLTSFRVNLSSGGFKVRCGCDTKAVYQAAKDLAERFGYRFPEKIENMDSAKPRLRNTQENRNGNGNNDRDAYQEELGLEEITIEKNYVQKAEDALYSEEEWVSIAGQLYRYTGEFYELQPDCLEKRRIAAWLSSFVEKTRYGYAYQRAKARNVNEVFQWIVYRQAVDGTQINLDGLNCKNGILQIFGDGTHKFIAHSPDRIFTYQGCKYDPAADSTDCDRLLECLEPAQREIFLRTAAAALALKLVRAKIGPIKGLLCFGGGSNGKDTLRTVLAAVLGQGMTGKTLQDFKAYDTGRKFCLAGLESSICNWASENSSAVKLDSIQSIKQFITGDELEIERKGKDAYSYLPNSIFLGNCNELPTITNGLEAIRRRYAILTFNKTYKRNADPSRGELEADPRLKNDPTFVSEILAPALLNKLLERIPLLLSEGIDYCATDAAMQEAQEDSRHLWAFAREAGVEYDGTSKVYIGDLYKILEEWYLHNGWLTIDESGKKPKKLWEAESQYDPPVKKSQDLYLRLRELFPHIERRVDTKERYGNKFIFGIKLRDSSQASQGAYVEGISSQGSSQGSSQASQGAYQPSQGAYVERVLSQSPSQGLSQSSYQGSQEDSPQTLTQKQPCDEMLVKHQPCDEPCDETLAQTKPCDTCDEIANFSDFCNLLPNEMKALSINQPWASLIALGHKRYERRGFQTNYRGKIAIHATAKKNTHEELLGIDAFQAEGLLPKDLPFSAVIVIADLVDCIQATPEFMESLTELDKRCCGSAIGGYLWKLENIQAIAPIPAKGQLGLWNWTPPEGDAAEPTHGDEILTEAIGDTKSLEEGDKIVTTRGTELVEIYGINKQWISLNFAETDKPMIEKGMPKARWVRNTNCVVSHKEFKEWVDVMSLRVAKVQATPTEAVAKTPAFPGVGDLVYRLPDRKYPGMTCKVFASTPGGLTVESPRGTFNCSHHAWSKGTFIPHDPSKHPAWIRPGLT